MSETNVFSESLKSLPNLERELRSLHSLNNHYEMQVSYKNTALKSKNVLLQ